MPTSIILLLDPHGSIPKDYLGREAQAWFLNQVKAHDPALSQALHDSSDLKPYTVSSLYTLVEGESGQPSGYYALRITAFSEPLESLLSRALLPNLPDRLKLWYGEFQIQQALTLAEQHPWAGRASFGNLIQAANQLRSTPLALDFVTPTAFRSEGIDIPLPIPSHIFRGCWQKWNACAPEAMRMDDSLFDFVQECVMVEALENINTTQLTFAGGKRGGVIGFTGKVGLAFHLKGRTAKWRADWDQQCAMLHTLGLFSFYCGCGHHTTIGLGQVSPSPFNGHG